MENDLESTHHPSSVDLPRPKSLPNAGDPGRNSGDRAGDPAGDEGAGGDVAMTIPKLRIGDVAQINPRPSRVPQLDEKVSFAGMTDLSAERECITQSALRPYAEVCKGYTPFHAQDILVAKITPCFENCKIGEASIPTDVGYGSTEFHVIRPLPARLDRRYLLHFLRQARILKTGERRMTGSAGQRRVPASFLEALEIPLPPLEEQRRIAAILDKANELNRLRKRQQSLCRDVELSIYYKEFGSPATNPFNWPTASLAEMAEIFSDGPFGSNLKSSHYVESGIRVVRLQNIGIGNFLDNDKAFVAPSHYETIKKHSCLPGDVLIGTLGEPNLRACMLPNGIPVAINKADCIQMRCDISLTTPLYITHLLNLPETNQMASSLILGQTRGRISMGRLKGFEVPMPPLEKQIQFARKIGALNSLRRRSASSASSIRNLVQSYSSWTLAPKDCQ
jgi:type I restriction enzyme S subunit